MNRICVVGLIWAWTAACANVADLPSLPCTYDTPELGFDEHPTCAQILSDGSLAIAPEHLQAMTYAGGLASAWVDGNWYYVRPDGASLRVLTYDNGPDPWSEGLVRSLQAGKQDGKQDGKIVYFDRDFEFVIPPRYDWGWPFEDGRALVCLGCRLDGAPGDEHRAVLGGEWGYIDRLGNEVVPVELSRSEALKVH